MDKGVEVVSLEGFVHIQRADLQGKKTCDDDQEKGEHLDDNKHPDASQSFLLHRSDLSFTIVVDKSYDL
jgi:hypothetical protein